MANHLFGPLQNKNFTHLKDFKMHQFDVQNVEQQKNPEWAILMAEVEDLVEDKDNLSRLHVLTVAKKTQYHSNQKVIDQYYVEIALEQSEANTLCHSG